MNTGQDLALLFASPGQINALIPYDLDLTHTIELLVHIPDTVSVPIDLATGAFEPGIFLISRPDGSAIPAIIDLDGNLLSASNKARRGDIIVIFCAGLGAVNPPVETGVRVTGRHDTMEPVSVVIGGVSTEVLFGGLAPEFAGLYQVNARVPASATPGDAVPLFLSMKGAASIVVALGCATKW